MALFGTDPVPRRGDCRWKNATGLRFGDKVTPSIIENTIYLQLKMLFVYKWPQKLILTSLFGIVLNTVAGPA